MSRATSGVAVAVEATMASAPEPARRVREPEVVRPEVVPPLGHAVRLVDHEQADPRLSQPFQEAGRGEPLRRDVQQPHTARDGAVHGPPVRRRVLLAVDHGDAAGRDRSSASTWSCINDTSGETTSVRSVRISAGSW